MYDSANQLYLYGGIVATTVSPLSIAGLLGLWVPSCLGLTASYTGAILTSFLAAVGQCKGMNTSILLNTRIDYTCRDTDGNGVGVIM